MPVQTISNIVNSDLIIQDDYTYMTITNTGGVDVSTGVSIYVTSSYDNFDVFGSVQSGNNDGIDLNGVKSTLTVEQSGYVSGAHSAIALLSGDGHIVSVAGLVTGNVGILDFGGGSNSITVDATGTVSGQVGILQSMQAAPSQIVNYGSIVGQQFGIQSTTNAGSSGETIENFGSITSQGASGIVINNAAGNVDSIVNSGSIAAVGDALDVYGGTATVANSGLISGNAVFGSTSAAQITNSGTWRPASGGTIAISSPGSHFTNSGAVYGSITMSGSQETLVNQAGGQLRGRIAIGDHSTFSNQGSLSGGVVAGNGSTVTNAGSIAGTISLGADDFLSTHTGGNALIYASQYDTIAFAADIGAQTLARFYAGTGKGHDVVQLSHLDVGGYAQLSALMVQQGANVYMNFGGGNSLTILNVTTAQLAPSDFAFV